MSEECFISKEKYRFEVMKMDTYKEVRKNEIINMYDEGYALDYIIEFVAVRELSKTKEARQRVEEIILQYLQEKRSAC